MRIPGSRGDKDSNVVHFEDRPTAIQFNSHAFRTEQESRLERRFGGRSHTPTDTQIIVTEEVWTDGITNAHLGIDDVGSLLAVFFSSLTISSILNRIRRKLVELIMPLEEGRRKKGKDRYWGTLLVSGSF